MGERLWTIWRCAKCGVVGSHEVEPAGALHFLPFVTRRRCRNPVEKVNVVEASALSAAEARATRAEGERDELLRQRDSYHDWLKRAAEEGDPDVKRMAGSALDALERAQVEIRPHPLESRLREVEDAARKLRASLSYDAVEYEHWTVEQHAVDDFDDALDPNP